MSSFMLPQLWVYINLASRPDRREHIERQLDELGVPAEQRLRIEAIKHEIGAYGCSQSHIEAVKAGIASGVPCFAVLEDDFEAPDARLMMETLAAASPCDVFLPSLGRHDRRTLDRGDGFHQVLRSQTASAYVVTSAFAPILLENFEYSKSRFFEDRHFFALDQFWTVLQPRSTWLCVLPPLGHQRPDVSDIEGTWVNYGC